MKKLSMLIGAVMLAGLCVTANAQTSNNYIYCRVILTDTNSGTVMGVDLGPDVSGYFDPINSNATCTVWELGSVPKGGVKDSFFDGGPGKFRVRNSGNSKAYIHIITGDHSGLLPFTSGPLSLFPTNALPTFGRYMLAVSTNVTGIIPTYTVLNKSYYWPNGIVQDPGPISWHNGMANQGLNAGVDYGYLGTFLGEALAGEYILFDLKFYAPTVFVGDRQFAVKLEAATFKYWP